MAPCHHPTINNFSTFANDFDTYCSLVTLIDPTKVDDFLRHINTSWGKVANNRLRLLFVGITFGCADVVVTWQAKDSDAAKEFSESVFGGYPCHSNTLQACVGHGQG